MKPGTTATRVVMLVLFVGVVLYFGIYAFQSTQEPFSTTYAYSYTVSDGVEATGLLVRQESVLPAQSGIVNLVAAEGEKVGKNQRVAVIYQSASAQERAQEISALELQAEQLEYALNGTGSGSTAAKLDSTIISDMVTLRGSAGQHNLTNLEDQVLELKSNILKREYAAGEGDAAALAEELGQLKSRLTSLRAQSGQDTRAVLAPQSGVFSARADGYESLATPENIFSLTPSALDELMAVGEKDTDALGKLITNSRWYFVTALKEDEAQRLTEGNLVTVRFSRDWSGDVSMRIESISDVQDGRVTVIFSSTRSLADTTLLRRQTVDIIFKETRGVRVPKEALRVREDGTPGVYCVVGQQAEFKEAQVLAEGSDYYVLKAAVDDKTSLRAGDEVIVQASGLFEGKVVR